MAEGTTKGAALPGWWRQMVSSQRREASRILGELMETRGIMPLLMKARNGESWSPTEKAQLLAHLRRMAHLSPYLIAFAARLGAVAADLRLVAGPASP